MATEARISHVVAEVVASVTPEARVSHILAEVVASVTPEARVSHILALVVYTEILEDNQGSAYVFMNIT